MASLAKKYLLSFSFCGFKCYKICKQNVQKLMLNRTNKQADTEVYVKERKPHNKIQLMVHFTNNCVQIQSYKLTQSHTHTHTHTHTVTQSHTHTHSHTVTQSHITHSHTVTHTHSHTVTHHTQSHITHSHTDTKACVIIIITKAQRHTRKRSIQYILNMYYNKCPIYLRYRLLLFL